MAAPKPCIQPGCRALVYDGTTRCAAHKRQASNFTRRESRHARGYGSAWDKLRQLVLQRDAGLCQACRAEGRVTAGNLVDHKVPKFEGGTDDLDNLQVLCKPCHVDKTAQESGRARRAGNPAAGAGQGHAVAPRPSAACGADGMPTDPRHPWTRRG